MTGGKIAGSGTQDQFQREFRFFSEVCAGFSPLYATLSRKVADDPAVMRLVDGCIRRQPPSNMLFGAVQYLLLAGAQHPLAEFYPSVGGGRPPQDAYPVFADFCRAFEQPIVDLVGTRRVQTNEVGRCGVLLPALQMVFERFERRPLYLIEVGASAGLNVLLDQYHYEYTRESLGEPVTGARGSSGNGPCPDGWRHSCGVESDARIHTRLRGDRTPPLPVAVPSVAGRVGIDVAPVDIQDQDAVRWIQALIWADQLQRVELFRAAVRLARKTPPRLIAGDGLDLLPGVIEPVPRDAIPVVFHSHCTYQMTDAWRIEFDALLGRLGEHRELAHISLEWLGDDSGPRLHLTDCSGGRRDTTLLADYQSHGVWLEWLD